MTTPAMKAVVADHERIWLQNAEDGAASGEGRMWCEDKAWPVDENDGEPTEYVRADLYRAALAQQPRTEPAGEAVAVKPLEWGETYRANNFAKHSADTPIGAYEVTEAFAVPTSAGMRTVLPSWKGPFSNGRHEAVSIDAAKAAAQADYEARIRSALATDASPSGESAP